MFQSLIGLSLQLWESLGSLQVFFRALEAGRTDPGSLARRRDISGASISLRLANQPKTPSAINHKPKTPPGCIRQKNLSKEKRILIHFVTIAPRRSQPKASRSQSGRLDGRSVAASKHLGYPAALRLSRAAAEELPPGTTPGTTLQDPQVYPPFVRHVAGGGFECVSNIHVGGEYMSECNFVQGILGLAVVHKFEAIITNKKSTSKI